VFELCFQVLIVAVAVAAVVVVVVVVVVAVAAEVLVCYYSKEFAHVFFEQNKKSYFHSGLCKIDLHNSRDR
jgi:hypothetical protein